MTKIEVLLDTVFSFRSVQSGYKEENLGAIQLVEEQLAGSSVLESLKEGSECRKLKNIHS
jgi:hypothetical protein